MAKKHDSPLIIAVDGPAASGKGTVARALAVHFGLPHLDTGLLYRAVGITCIRSGANPERADDAAAACQFDDAVLSDPELRSERASNLASRVSVHAAVRTALLDRQRAFAAQSGGAILDGRDIGTVIAPNADAKLFVVATPEIRARRRADEFPHKNYSTILADILLRDERDTGRLNAPLAMARDADLLDTSDLTIGDVIERAITLVEARISAKRVSS